MGGVGSILVLLSFIPFVGFVLGIVGLVMVLIAVKHISNVVNDREIFNNVLMAVILQIVGSAISAFVVIGSLLSMFMMAPLGTPFGSFAGPGHVWRWCSPSHPRHLHRRAYRDVGHTNHRDEVPQEGLRGDSDQDRHKDVQIGGTLVLLRRVAGDSPSRVRPDPDRSNPPNRGVLLPTRVSTVTTNNTGSGGLT